MEILGKIAVPLLGFRPEKIKKLDLAPSHNEQTVPLSPGWAIVENGGGTGGQRWFDPAGESALYRNLAAVDVDSPEQVAAFASQYGPLYRVLPWPVDGSGPKDRVTPFAQLEFGSIWVQAVTRLRLAIDAWDAAKAGDLAWLELHCRPDGETPFGRRWWFSNHHGNPRPGGSPYGHVMDPVIEPSLADVGSAARAWARGQANRWIRENGRSHWSVDPETGRERDDWVPETLCGAVWQQFKRACVAEKEAARCRVCQKWFDADPKSVGGRSARAVFCSDACKSRDYRARKDRTMALAADGNSAKDIAARLKAEGLETDFETVKKWTGKKR